MNNRKQDPAKKMQTIGILLLVVLFGGWVYYQSWTVSKLENKPPEAGLVDSKTPESPKDPKEIGTTEAAEVGIAKAQLRLAQAEVAGATDEQVQGTSEKTPSNDTQTEAPQFKGQPIDLSPIVVETAVYRAVLSPEGAVLHSLILKQHDNNGQPLEMVRSVNSGLYPFAVYLGDYNDGQPIMLPFRHEKIGELAYRFSTEFTVDETGSSSDPSDPYILEKTLEFAPNEYMIKVSVRLQRKSGHPLPQNQRRVIYSLYYGPQMGPEVDHIGSNRTAMDTRSYVYFNGKKSKTVSLGRSSRDKRLDSSPIWAGISGKYFGVFALPSRNLDVYWSRAQVLGLGLDASGSELESSQFLFERRAAHSDDNLADDTFYYYIGPLLANDLSVFNKSSDNEFGLSDASLNSLVKFSLGFIEEPVKWVLTTLYRYTGNYGIAIILFALIVRLLLYPLTLKSFRSTSRMRLIQPQMKELQERHKGDARRLQQEMGGLYRREKVNPAGGCLPILIQMPILIAIANLFYRYFELRGATFIPGWIGDLSAPDFLYSLTFLSWDIPLRVLPIIYLGSQLLSSKLMQASQPPMQNKMQQRMFTVYMPIFFSIILYNMPSGLILYWTISNILTTAQQLLMTRYLSDDGTEVKHEADAVIAQNNKNYSRHTSKRDKRGPQDSPKIAPQNGKSGKNSKGTKATPRNSPSLTSRGMKTGEPKPKVKRHFDKGASKSK